MADPKKDQKTDGAPTVTVDARDTELARLRAELAKAQAAPASAGGAILERLVDGQNQLAAAVAELAKAQAAASRPEMLKHADLAGPDGKLPLDPEHKGTKKYRTTRPGFHQGAWRAPGFVIEVTDQKPSRTWKLVTGKEPAEETAPAPAAIPASRPSDAQT